MVFPSLRAAPLSAALAVSCLLAALPVGRAAAQAASQRAPAGYRLFSSSLAAGTVQGSQELLASEDYDAGGRLVMRTFLQPTPAGGPVKREVLRREYRYDRAGKLAVIVERRGEGAGQEKVERIGRDAEGRIVSLAVESKGKLAWRLDYAWDGSASLVVVTVRDGAGALAARDELRMGEGAAVGMALEALRRGPGGELVESRFFGVDAGGRLTRIAVLPGAGQVGESGPGQVSAPVEAGIPPAGYLLAPAWPGEGPWLRGACQGIAGPALPFDPPSEGSAELLWDGGGRLIRARLLDAEGLLADEAEWRYDSGGLLGGMLRLDGSVTFWRYEGAATGAGALSWARRRVSWAPGGGPDGASPGQPEPSSLERLERR